MEVAFSEKRNPLALYALQKRFLCDKIKISPLSLTLVKASTLDNMMP